MNLLSELTFKLGDEEVIAKLTNKALYRAQLELKLNGLLELIQAIDTMDLKVLFTLLKHSCNGEHSIEDLMDSELTISEVTEFIAQNIAVLFEAKKDKPAPAKKKGKK